MIYCDNNFKKIIKAFIRALRVFFSSLFLKRLLLMIIVALFIMLLHLNVHAATSTIDLYNEIRNKEEYNQNEFVLTFIPEYINNTLSWQQLIQPIIDDLIDNKYDIYCEPAIVFDNNTITQNVYLYKAGDSKFSFNWSMGSFHSLLTNQNEQIMNTTISKIDVNTIYYDKEYHQISKVVRSLNQSVSFPTCIENYKSSLLTDFLVYYEGFGKNSGGSNQNYTPILESISNYLSNLDTSNTNINNQLSSVLQILNTIAQKNPTDYTDQISGITNQVNSVSSSIQAQTQQQHQDAQATQNAINNQTQQQHEDAQATQNTIEESTNSILSTEADDITMEDFGVSSPTIEGSPDLTNIFNLIYNSFMSVYEDDIYRIQFKLPSGDTTYNFDIPANALRDKLPEGLIMLISVFWWVILGGAVISFIVKIIHQVVTYSNGSVDGSGGGFLSELTMTPTEFVLFNILH